MSPSAILPEALVIPEVPLESFKAPAKIRSTYEIREEPLHTRRPLRIICLGAGYSAMLMGIIHDQRLEGRNIDLVLYERNETLGGTWLENRYPG